MDQRRHMQKVTRTVASLANKSLEGRTLTTYDHEALARADEKRKKKQAKKELR